MVRPKTNIAFKIPMWMYLKWRNKKQSENWLSSFDFTRSLRSIFKSNFFFYRQFYNWYKKNRQKFAKISEENEWVQAWKNKKINLNKWGQRRIWIHSGFDEILLWNQDFIRIKKRIQKSLRIGKTFETLDKKTKIAFKIPIWIIYLKCKTKLKKIDCSLLISRDLSNQFSKLSKIWN